MRAEHLVAWSAALFLLLLPATHGQDVGWAVSMEKSIEGNDISCGQMTPENKPASYCRVCGGIAAVASACEQNSKCRGFDMENWQCGYLKSKADRTAIGSQVNFVSFCKFVRGDKTSNCRTGEYVMWIGWTLGPKWDWDCGAKEEGQPLKNECRSKGTTLSLMSACDKWGDKCDGFTVEVGNNEFGVLKRSDFLFSSMTRRDGWIWFVKNRGNPTVRSAGRNLRGIAS